VRSTRFALLLTSLLVGCPGSDRCTEGMSVSCACTDGRTGAQVCSAAGTYGACVCAAGDAGTDAPTVDRGDVGPPPCVREVDLLFQIDTSRSMGEEQAVLRSELPRLVTVLASGDRDGDGTADFPAVTSLHLGVITPDLGAGDEASVPTCALGLGDDGILRSEVAVPDGACAAAYPSGIFVFAAGTNDPATVAADFACVANVGTDGCGFEQQLEAALKALSPSRPTPWVRSDYAPPAFALSPGGQGDRENDGFVRDGSLLAITIVTDEDDCSTTVFDLFDPMSSVYSETSMNLRCIDHPAALHPIDRYRDGFLQLRDDPRLLVFTVIGGAPTDVTILDTAAGYDALLANPAMELRPGVGTLPVEPACESAAGFAFPARRLVETARALNAAGAGTHVGSICSGDFSADIDAIVDAVVAGTPSCG